MRTSPSYTASYRIEVDEATTTAVQIVDTVAATGAEVKGLDVADSDRGRIVIDLTCDMRDSAHRAQVRDALAALPGVKTESVADQTFMSHIGGKIEIHSKVPLRNRDDLSRAYTPGVARVCTAIHDMPQKAHLLTMKANTVAVVSDGTAVLGLGDIGPEAALPVMEGKAVLFKEFGGVDAWPVVLDTKDTEEIIAIVKAIAPGYGGINLEDISAPRCFEIEERLRSELDIPVFHDDQHGTAIVVLAALLNALKIVGKRIEDVRIVLSGVGAAGSAIAKLLMAHGATDIVGYGRTGALDGAHTEGMNEHRRWLAENTNPRHVTGDLKEGLVGAALEAPLDVEVRLPVAHEHDPAAAHVTHRLPPPRGRVRAHPGRGAPGAAAPVHAPVPGPGRALRRGCPRSRRCLRRRPAPCAVAGIAYRMRTGRRPAGRRAGRLPRAASAGCP